jgi:hypothetical protein
MTPQYGAGPWGIADLAAAAALVGAALSQFVWYGFCHSGTVPFRVTSER